MAQATRITKTSQYKKHRHLNITLRAEYHTVLRQYKDLLNHKKSEFVNSRPLELENYIDDSDNNEFWNCLKSMDDTIKPRNKHPSRNRRKLDVSFPITTLKRTT